MCTRVPGWFSPGWGVVFAAMTRTLPLLALLSCTGIIAVPPDAIEQDPSTVSPKVCAPKGKLAATPMIRISRAQMDNLTHDLLGAKFQPSSILASDEKEGPFAVNAVTPMSVGLASQYQFIAEAIGDEVEARPLAFAPCAVPTTQGRACAQTLVRDLGRRTYRRPLTVDESQRWLALYEQEAMAAGYAGGVRAVIEGMLQSPNFLYRVEPILTGAAPSTKEPWPLDGYALATRLSFLLWNSGPDDALLDTAMGDGLTRETMPGQVDRMLDDPRALQSMEAFTEGWAGIESLPAAAASAGRLGGLDPKLVPMMHDDTVGFVDGVLRKGDGRLATLFTSTRTPASPELATEIYGVPTAAGARGDVQLPSNRSGILSNASVLFTHAHSEQTSPVLRGRWLRENILCQPIPDPPPTVVAVPAPPVPGQTTRQRNEAHRADVTCAACHRMLDDVGFGFEAFDQYGRHRTLDQDQFVDDSGKLVATDIDGNFRGVTGLGRKLSTSKLAATCFARQWYRYGLGHDTGTADVCTLEQMATAVTTGEGFREALHVLVRTDAFLQRSSP